MVSDCSDELNSEAKHAVASYGKKKSGFSAYRHYFTWLKFVASIYIDDTYWLGGVVICGYVT